MHICIYIYIYIYIYILCDILGGIQTYPGGMRKQEVRMDAPGGESTLWRNAMETLPALLVLCAGLSLYISHCCCRVIETTLQWRHNGCDNASNHQPCDCLLNRLFRRRSKKTSNLRATGLCAGNSPGTGEFPAQMASYAENVSIWWRYHVEHKQACRINDSERSICSSWSLIGKR